jgi:hypothetical protein
MIRFTCVFCHFDFKTLFCNLIILRIELEIIVNGDLCHIFS